MKKLLFILPVFYFTAINSQPVASPNSVLKLTEDAMFVATGGVLVTIDNLHLDNQGYINSYPNHNIREPYMFRFSGDSTTNIQSWGAHFFDHLKIAKTGGALLQLHAYCHVFSSVDFESGLIDLNTQHIYLYDTAVLNGESESSRIIDLIGGGAVFAYGSPSPGSTINPGNLGLEITPSSSTTTVPNPAGFPNNVMTVSRGHISWSTNSLHGSVLRHYSIAPCTNYYFPDCFNGGNDYSAKLRFKYFNVELNGFDESQLSMWELPHFIGQDSYDTVNNYVEKTITIHYYPYNVQSYFLGVPAVSPRPATLAGQRLINSLSLPNEKNSWKTWPNPAGKVFWIDITSTSASLATTSIFDSKGALIRTQTNPLMQGSNRLAMDLKNLAAGIYYITTQWDTGKEKRSTKFVKL
jgi:Secretion system C-terminal sorting domain